MKKIILMLVAASLVLTASAQNQSNANINEARAQKEALKNEKLSEEESKDKNWGGNNEVAFTYNGLKHGYGISFRLTFKGFFAQYDNFSQDISGYKMTTDAWDIKVGYSYRCWFGKHLFVQAPLGLGYINSKTKVITGKNKEEYSGSGFLLSVNPALGLRLWDGWTIEAGYEWDFTDFKFDKEHKSDYFTIGVAYCL